jgi:hypothetical protein
MSVCELKVYGNFLFPNIHKMNMHKIITLLFMLSTLLSLITINLSFAQFSKPTVPEFTLNVVEHPYNVAPITTIDPYTGKTVITQAEYNVENTSIQIVIKNQPFTPYNSNGEYIVLSYNVSLKGHYDDSWKYYPNAYWKIPLIASKSDYTVISFGSDYNESDPYSYQWDVPDSGKVDFRVEALIGYYNETITLYPIPGGEFHNFQFIGESSGWSNTQTLTIDNSQIPTPTPSQESQQPDLTIIVGVAVVAVVLAAGLGLLIYLAKRK